MHLSVFVAGESQGEWVWVDTDAEVAIGARVKVTPSGQRLLVDDEGKVNMGTAPNQDVLVAYQATFEAQLDPSSRSTVCPRSWRPHSGSCTPRWSRAWTT